VIWLCASLFCSFPVSCKAEQVIKISKEEPWSGVNTKNIHASATITAAKNIVD